MTVRRKLAWTVLAMFVVAIQVGLIVAGVWWFGLLVLAVGSLALLLVWALDEVGR